MHLGGGGPIQSYRLPNQLQSIGMFSHPVVVPSVNIAYVNLPDEKRKSFFWTKYSPLVWFCLPSHDEPLKEVLLVLVSNLGPSCHSQFRCCVNFTSRFWTGLNSLPVVLFTIISYCLISCTVKDLSLELDLMEDKSQKLVKSSAQQGPFLLATFYCRCCIFLHWFI